MMQFPKKILILGNGASGKTTLAKKISSRLNMPILHLDSIYWDKNWEHSNQLLFLNSVNNFMKQEKWILEGTPMLGIKERILSADTIIFLDFSKLNCLKNALYRSLLNILKKEKPDDHGGCPALKINFKTLKWIWKFNNEKRAIILNEIKLSGAKNKIIIKNRYELNQLLLAREDAH